MVGAQLNRYLARLGRVRVDNLGALSISAKNLAYTLPVHMHTETASREDTGAPIIVYAILMPSKLRKLWSG